MPTRNTEVIREIVKALGDNLNSPIGAQGKLERHFADQFLIVVGDVQKVMHHAAELRLRITTPEAGQVLDHIGSEALSGMHIDLVDEVINDLFPDRFQEP